MKRLTIIVLNIFIFSAMAMSQIPYPYDDVKSTTGSVRFYFIKHASLIMVSGGKVIYTDPIGEVGDYAHLPKADLVLLTHHHSDHYDENVLRQITKTGTQFVVTPTVFEQFKKGVVMKNWDMKVVDSVLIKAVPAYNTTEGRDKYHPKGRDNGYILKLGGLKIYIAGDTENIPEMSEFKEMDVVFLPMNQPYTMTPAQVASAAHILKPRILYPYHTGDTDVSTLAPLMKDLPHTELRIRSMP